MKIVPGYILKEASSPSNQLLMGEKHVRDLLEQLHFGVDAVCLHSLDVSEHQYKQWSELDYVLISREGVLVLEVKGGIVSFEDGIWTYANGRGQSRRNTEGPFRQAQLGMWSLKKMVVNHFGESAPPSNLFFGWGVVFPFTRWTYETPEMPRSVVADERDCADKTAFYSYLKQVYGYWQSKSGGRHRGNRVTKHQMDELLEYLRPNFCCVSPVGVVEKQTDERRLRLTRKQWEMLEQLRQNKRILCTGGAGTGKSVLAQATTRAEVAAGRKVLFVVGDSIFAAFLRRGLKSPSVEVIDRQALNLFSALPESERPKFDVLVVDEGQDLLAQPYLESLDKLCKGGIDSGRWRWFMDINNQADIWQAATKDAERRLYASEPTQVLLDLNVRNTVEIVENVQQNLGADIGNVESQGLGFPVRYDLVSDRVSEARKLQHIIRKWVDENGVEPADITILSPLEFEKSIARTVLEGPGSTVHIIHAPESVAQLGTLGITFSSVRRFKGLENKYIVLVDLDYLDTGKTGESELYVAMTRAYVQLNLLVGPVFDERLERLRARYLDMNLKRRGIH